MLTLYCSGSNAVSIHWLYGGVGRIGGLRLSLGPQVTQLYHRPTMFSSSSSLSPLPSEALSLSSSGSKGHLIIPSPNHVLIIIIIIIITITIGSIVIIIIIIIRVQRSPNYTIAQPFSAVYHTSPTNLSSFLIIYTVYNQPLLITQKIGILLNPTCSSSISLRSRFVRNPAQIFGNGNHCNAPKKMSASKCMQAHLPGRKGIAVSWVQPMFGIGD